DQENPVDAIFPREAEALSSDDRAAITRAYKRGVELKAIARKYCRTRQTIYRVIVDERIARFEKKKIRFIDDPLYHEPDAESAIEAIVNQEVIGETQARQEWRVPKDLPPYLADLYRVPLLSAAQERGLFLLLNYRKYLFAMERRKLDPQDRKSVV